jgi:hypothetical protein
VVRSDERIGRGIELGDFVASRDGQTSEPGAAALAPEPRSHEPEGVLSVKQSGLMYPTSLM